MLSVLPMACGYSAKDVFEFEVDFCGVSNHISEPSGGGK